MSKTMYGGSASNENQPGNQPPAPVGKGTVVMSGAGNTARISQQNPLTGFFVSFSKSAAGECWELREGNLYVIGKAHDADILLNEKAISDRHATLQIRRSNDEEKRLMIVISDTNSTNGTVVNGKDIGINGHTGLQHQDKVLLGNYELVFILLDQEKLQLAPNEKFQAAVPATGGDAFDYSAQSLYNKQTKAG
jgi:pSer/pThr/pTyr-binding forkhead associated (FHA) protein